MKASPSLALCVLLFVGFVLLANEGMSREIQTARGPVHIARYSPHLIQTSRGNPFSKAPADSFNLYGGARSDGTNNRRPEGQFQTIEFAPDFQGWQSVDLTENPVRWHASTFNASTLDTLAGNTGMFCGVEATEPGFSTAPGYGNNYNDNLDWNEVGNIAQNTLVRLEFDYHYDLEPGFDRFAVQYDSAGVWVDWIDVSGTNKDSSGLFTTPVHFDESVLFTPPMYTGNPPFFVHLRMRVTSDGGGSDEDGLFDSSGAVQIDNVKVYYDGVLNPVNGDGIATFEDVGGVDDEGWFPVAADFVGDFGKLLPALSDLDPCRTNFTPQLGFIDNSSPPNNAISGENTGGQQSNNWSYGVTGGWVINYNGGLTNGVLGLNNEFRSPEIDWNDPNSTEDDALDGGAFVRFTVWQHLPIDNGLYWRWAVRSREVGNPWSSWQDRGVVYFGDGGGTFVNAQIEISDLLVSDPEKLQLALGVVDLSSDFAFPGTDATPSPTFDNVSVWRYSLGGPAITARNIDLFHDGFPNSGATDPIGAPSEMSVRLDMARDINSGASIVPGDSIVVDVVPTVPGTSLDGPPELVYLLEANPLFDAVRTVPAGAVNLGTTARGFTRWLGTAPGAPSTTSSGTVIPDRFFLDFPADGPAISPHQTSEPAGFFPGDRFRYFVRSTDTGMFTSTLPPDTTGFFSGEKYDRLYTIRALPSIISDGSGGTEQPNILLINDYGHQGEEQFLHAFDQLGMVEDVDFDTYTVIAPSSLISNGIGSSGAHGATPQQLEDYGCMLYFAGDLTSGLLSRGSNLDGNDKGDDIGTLTTWHVLPGDRYMAHFGDDICTFLDTSAEGQQYSQAVLGVTYGDENVADEIGGTIAPIVQPTGAIPAFSAPFLAYAGCLNINRFDSIQPNVSPFSIATHKFTDGSTIFAPAAGVWHERTVLVDSTPYRRIDVTFPYGFEFIYNYQPSNGISSRTTLLGDLLAAFQQNGGSGSVVAADPISDAPMEVHANRPNPFNPSTSIGFSAPRQGHVSVKVYNLRGELVDVLLDEPVEPGSHAVEWHGTDRSGSKVGSGVYLYAVEGFGQRITHKMALVK